ncbi:hypothetical protein BDQ12DRAFT_688042 [Crucibulum laeve]|uniref:FAD/NAD(P)-binding domain-containing protein n=1 Tax=Crucibulum laeve TaxID=68775 RepID=A0A5C3LUF9_9AGAR|nr:hypothetical protein BDQ12DRAFT_688042 [Crucibulum laeve]
MPQMDSLPAFSPPQGALPTLEKLGTTAPENVDALKVASTWLSSFEKHLSSVDVEGVLSLFVQATYSSLTADNDPSALSFYWRDILAFTWDIRTFEGTAVVRQFLTDRLEQTKASNLQLKLGPDGKAFVIYQQLYPDLAWVQLMFTFETDVGLASGIVRLVPTPGNATGDIEWKAHSVFTNLEDLKGFPEKLGLLRKAEPQHGRWVEERERERLFLDKDPTVLVIGGGQSGLEIAARLKFLELPTLIVEKNNRIGDNWRNRYEALCLHDLVWYDHMPYIPFPSTWPVYTPAKKFANWMESYADVLELNVWTSSKVSNAKQDPDTQLWHVTVQKEDGTERLFKVKHLIFAIGYKGGKPNMPKYPGMDEFKGQIIHSTQHNKATDHLGKKIFVIGSGASAHDISVDYVNHGIDVTMFQRSPTFVMTVKNGSRLFFGSLYSENGLPTDVADRIFASYAMGFNIGMVNRLLKYVAHEDKDILDGLRSRGFKMDEGLKGAGPLLNVWLTGGGFYLDVGGSQYIIDGKIKLKNDALIESFTETGIKFDDGSEMEADVVVCATGLGNVIEGVREICGNVVAEGCTLSGITKEGEPRGIWRELPFKGLWYMMGNLGYCRFHSKHLALQIKAIEENVIGERYSLQE